MQVKKKKFIKKRYVNTYERQKLKKKKKVKDVEICETENNYCQSINSSWAKK